MKVGRVAVVAVLVLAIALIATHNSAKAERTQESLPHITDVAGDTAPPPLRVVLAIDDSLSMATARVPQISGASLAPILDRIETTGGEVAVGFIRERSDAPLLRLYVPPPPDASATKIVAGDIFTRAKLKGEQDRRAAEVAAGRRAWRSDASARVNAFLGELSDQLAAPADAKRTDIRSMIVRSDLFLSEPTTYGKAARNVIIVVSDGIDDVNVAPPPPLASHADLLVVNGVGTTAYLEPLKPLRFESLDAALRFAVAEEVRRVR